MGLDFGARVLGWDSRGAEVEMPGRAGGGSWAHGLARSNVICLMLSVAKVLVSIWR